MEGKVSKRQVSFRMSLDEWEDLRRLHHIRCLELGRWISQTSFIKEILFSTGVALVDIDGR